MNTTREAYKAKMETQLNVWSAWFSGLNGKLDKASVEAKIAFLERATEFNPLQSSAYQQLAAVEASGGDRWDAVKGGIEHTWCQLATSVETVWAKRCRASSARH